jgi:glutathione S-transferase
MIYVDIVVALAAIQFLVFGMQVGAARGRYGVKAPAIGGNETFERYFRVQMNTLECMVLLLPAIYLFSRHVSPGWAAGLGAVYLIGRQIYAISYVRDPASRGPGFGLSMSPIMVMLAGGLGMAIWHQIHGSLSG